jgi:thioester reductase-like protein/acyl carrier protein
LSLESGLPSRKPVHRPETAQMPELKNVSHGTQDRESVASKLTEALDVIAEASGIAATELTDDTVFADVGIDSLMGLTISACLREQLGLDIDFQSFVFDYPTIGDLKSHLEGVLGYSKSTHTTTSSSSTTAISTPVSGGSATPLGIDFQRVLGIVSEESGIAVADLTDDTEFADAGVDSLLSIIVASRLKDELGLSITHDSLFTDCPTVLDLRRMLSDDVSPPIGGARADSVVLGESPMCPTAVRQTTQQTIEKGLMARKELVSQYIRKHTAGLSVPVSSSSASQPSDQSKVVLVTGASGSLGANLVHHLAQLPDTISVICLNRKNAEDPFTRQKKAMRNKGIRFPQHLEAKLCVIQTDTTEPMLGLSETEYEKLACSVTHIIHNAWPMSAKRPLSGFESQFQVLRNLIDFSYRIAARRPETFRLAFQMVSSIGVVGHYGRENAEARTTVPETQVDISSVLPNGYSEAKWGCEQMLNTTLQQHPHRFRAMIVRLGQIAGSRTSGYWNPMEHFGFLVKSSQTLNALPDVPGLAYWTTVNDVAATLADLALAERAHYPIYHVDNPVGQSWKTLNSVIADALNITDLIPFEEWVERVRAAPQRNNPASTLLEFLDDNYLRMSCGGLVLDVKHAMEHSTALSAVGPVTEEVVRKYLHVWREIGFLSV